MSLLGFQKLGRRSLTKLWYAPILAIAMGLMLLRLILIAYLLPVSDFGAYSAGLLVSSSFCMLACFGLQSLLQRDLPIMIVRQRERAGGVLLMQCVLVTVAAALLGLFVLLALGGSLVGLSKVGVCIAILHGASQQLFTVATIDSRSRNLPVRFARQNLDRAVALVLVGPVVTWLGGTAPTILAFEAALTFILSGGLLLEKFRSGKFAFTSALHLAWIRLPKVQWTSALTLLAVSILSFVILNVDRWIATQWLSASLFGQYAFAWTLFSVAQSVQLIVNASVFPLLAQKYANHGRQTSFKFAASISVSFMIISSIISVFCYFIIVEIVKNYFVKFSAVTGIIPVFLLAISFRVSDFWSSFMIVNGEERKMLLIIVFNMILTIGIWVIYLEFDFKNITIFSIAVLALLISFINYVIIAAFSWKVANYRDQKSLS